MMHARNIIDSNFMIYRIDNDLQPILPGEYWELRQSHGLELSKCWASLRRCKITTGPPCYCTRRDPSSHVWRVKFARKVRNIMSTTCGREIWKPKGHRETRMWIRCWKAEAP